MLESRRTERLPGKVLFGVRIVAFITLAVLVFFGMERFWLPVLLLGICANFFRKRWYCWWICPVHCVAVCSKVLYESRKTSLKRFPVPLVLRAKWFSMIWLAGLFIAFLTCLILGTRVRLFVWISVIGILFSLLFPIGVWCNTLCPWGRIIQFSVKLFSTSCRPLCSLVHRRSAF